MILLEVPERMRYLHIACWSLLGFALTLGGCARLQYRSISPSMRSFNEDPWVDDMYFGADAEFAVTDRRQERHLSYATLPARPDTLDAWNPPIAWDQIPSREETRIEHVETDAAPAFEDWGRLSL